ncbi:MAG: TylF/MycF/NovP-related O-methyltransferase, partial [Rhodospirillaceae bacterium]
MSISSMQFRASVPLNTTVYDACPTLKQAHAVNRVDYADMKEDFFWEVFDRYKKFTCLSVERFYNIFKSIEYIAKSGLTGDIAKCGVFLGGSIIAAAHFAEYFGLKGRKYYAFDTFEGFPTNTVKTDISGVSCDLSTLTVFNRNFRHVVENNIANSGLDQNQFMLVAG